jgi:hypothetical protein
MQTAWALREASDPATAAERLRALAQSDSREILLCLARNPSTPEDVLLSLSTYQVAELRSAVLRNPAVPLLALFFLGCEDPPGFWENPALAMWLLEDPSFLENLPPETMAALARHPSAPERLLEIAVSSRSGDVREGAAANPTLSAALCARLASGGWGDALRTLARNPVTPPEILRELYERDVVVNLWKSLVENPSAPPDLLALMAEGALLTQRAAALQHPRFPHDILDGLVRLGSAPDLCGYRRPDLSLSPEELTAAATRGPWVRSLVAWHPNTPPALFSQLAKDPRPEVRFSVACSPALPPAQWAELATSEDEWLVSGAAQSLHLDSTHPNPELAQALSRVAKQGSPRLRMRLATHPLLPREDLERLVTDEDPAIVAAARQSLEKRASP